MTKDKALKIALAYIKMCELSWEDMLVISAMEEALAQPEREWVSLEDEEVIRLAKHYRHAPITLIGTVEALLKEMNHG